MPSLAAYPGMMQRARKRECLRVCRAAWLIGVSVREYREIGSRRAHPEPRYVSADLRPVRVAADVRKFLGSQDPFNQARRAPDTSRMRSVTRVAGWTLLVVGASAIASGAVLALPHIDKAFSSDLPQPGELTAFVPFAAGVGILALSRRLLRHTRLDTLPERTFVRPPQTETPAEPLRSPGDLPFEDWEEATLGPLACPCETFLVVRGSHSFRAGVASLVGVSTDRVRQTTGCAATEEYVMANPYDRGVIVVAPEVREGDFLPMAEFIRRSFPLWAVIVLREAGSNHLHGTHFGVDSVIETGGSRLILGDAMEQALA